MRFTASAMETYPFVKPWTDRHGRVRWRFRRLGKVTYLPGQPGDAEFETAFEACVRGVDLPKPKRAIVRQLPTAAPPRSIRAAWVCYVKGSPEWHECSPETRARQTAIAESFLNEPVSEGEPSWGSLPIADLKRRHMKLIIARMSATPHAARHRLVVIRKMITAALDQEWIETDPTYGLKYRPKYKGHRAWTWTELEAFERHWPVGSTPRLVYTLAFWFGNRRKDVAAMTPADIDMSAGVATVEQSKTGKVVRIPLSPDARAAIAKLDLAAPALVMTEYGKPYSHKSLTEMMRIWTAKAGLTSGCVLHGLRKTLGALTAEAGGTTKQSMAILGHIDIAHAELYSRAADEAILAREGMEKVVSLVEARRQQKKAG